VTAAVLSPAAAAVVALGCACLANLVMGRCPASLFEWNESFLIGLGIVSAAAIPLSLLGRPWIRFVLLIAILVAILIRRTDLSRFRATGLGLPPGSGVKAAAAVFPGLVLFAVANARSAFAWDGFQIWMTKAQEFYKTGTLRLNVPTPEYMLRIVSYPPAVAVDEALVATFYRAFPFDAVKAVFTVFAVSIVIGTFHLVETVSDRRTAVIAAGLTAVLPGLMMRTAIGGYADMPLAAVVAAAAAASLRTDSRNLSWRSPAPWLLGTLTTIKSEGTVLLCIGLAVASAYAVARRPRVSWRAATSAAPLAFFVLARVAQRTWIPGQNVEFASLGSLRLRTVVLRGPLIVSGILHWLSDFRLWGVLWPAFAVALFVLAWTGRRSPAMAIGATALLAAVGDGAIFFWTRWGDFRLHLDQAYPRLLAQIAPLAIATVGAAVFCVKGRAPGTALVPPRARPLLGPRSRRVARAAAAVAVLGSVFAAGGAAAFHRLVASLRAPQEELLPEEISRALPAARRALPPGAPVFYVTADANTWRCGLWQRALYPRPVFCVRPAPPSRRELANLRSAFAVRWAIGVAEPPPDLPVIRRKRLSDRVWIGEVGP